MTKKYRISKKQKARIIQYIKRNTDYDEKTVQIRSDGMITAKFDADKTFEGNDNRRYNVGYFKTLEE